MCIRDSDRVKTGKEWEKVMADPDIDAVVIATPDFWHAPMTIRAAESKKDVYVEKGWCTKLEDAKRMRAALKENKTVMQLGHNYNLSLIHISIRGILLLRRLGRLPLT